MNRILTLTCFFLRARLFYIQAVFLCTRKLYAWSGKRCFAISIFLDSSSINLTTGRQHYLLNPSKNIMWRHHARDTTETIMHGPSERRKDKRVTDGRKNTSSRMERSRELVRKGSVRSSQCTAPTYCANCTENASPSNAMHKAPWTWNRVWVSASSGSKPRCNVQKPRDGLIDT